MWIIKLLTVLLVSSLLIGFISKILKIRLLDICFAYLLIVTLAAFVSYTPDWAGYEYWINSLTGKGFLFKLFINKWVTSPSDYSKLHIVYISIYTTLLLFIIAKFCRHYIALIALIYLTIIYVFYATQIRYFLAYYLAMNAFYYFIIKKNVALSVVLFILAALSHLSILLCLFLLFFIFKEATVFRKYVILSSFIGFILLPILASLFKRLNVDLYFSYYIIDPRNESSLLGGLFSFLPFIISIILLEIDIKRTVRKNNGIIKEAEFNYLYKMAVGPYIFFGLALKRQIFGYRFITVSFIFQLLLFAYLLKYVGKNEKIIKLFSSIFFIIFTLVYIYYVPNLFDKSSLYDLLVPIIKSNIIYNFNY
jgi:hypothetical protein